MGKEIQRLLLRRRKFGREPLRRRCGRQCGSSGSSLRSSSSTPSASSPAPSNRRTAPLRQGARCLLGEIHPSASTGELEQTHLAIVEATTVTCVCDKKGSDLLVELGNGRESGGGDLTQSVVPSPHLITYSPDLQVLSQLLDSRDATSIGQINNNQYAFTTPVSTRYCSELWV